MKKMDFYLADMKHSNLVKERSRPSYIYQIGNLVVKKTIPFVPNME